MSSLEQSYVEEVFASNWIAPLVRSGGRARDRDRFHSNEDAHVSPGRRSAFWIWWLSLPKHCSKTYAPHLPFTPHMSGLEAQFVQETLASNWITPLG